MSVENDSKQQEETARRLCKKKGYGLIPPDESHQWGVEVHPPPGQIGAYRETFRGDLSQVINWLDEAQIVTRNVEIYQPRFYKIAPNDKQCRWESGDPTIAEDEPAIIEVQWQQDGFLKIALGGFIRTWPKSSTVECRWLSSKNKEKASGKPENRFIPVVLLQPDDGNPPQPGDKLEIHNVHQPSTSGGWDMQVEITL